MYDIQAKKCLIVCVINIGVNDNEKNVGLTIGNDPSCGNC